MRLVCLSVCFKQVCVRVVCALLCDVVWYVGLSLLCLFVCVVFNACCSSCMMLCGLSVCVFLSCFVCLCVCV